MRLIDADALTKDLCENYIFTGFNELLDDFASAIRAQPTVDAVLIGWIEEQIRESYDASKEYDGCYDYAWALSELVKRWRVENGSVD